MVDHQKRSHKKHLNRLDELNKALANVNASTTFFRPDLEVSHDWDSKYCTISFVTVDKNELRLRLDPRQKKQLVEKLSQDEMKKFKAKKNAEFEVFLLRLKGIKSKVESDPDDWDGALDLIELLEKVINNHKEV